MFCKFVVELVGANDCVMGEERGKNGANENKAWSDECVFFMLEDVERQCDANAPCGKSSGERGEKENG